MTNTSLVKQYTITPSSSIVYEVYIYKKSHTDQAGNTSEAFAPEVKVFRIGANSVYRPIHKFQCSSIQLAEGIAEQLIEELEYVESLALSMYVARTKATIGWEQINNLFPRQIPMIAEEEPMPPRQTPMPGWEGPMSSKDVNPPMPPKPEPMPSGTIEEGTKPPSSREIGALKRGMELWKKFTGQKWENKKD